MCHLGCDCPPIQVDFLCQCGRTSSAADGNLASRRSQESWFQLKQNTSVYVTGLPPDATETAVAQHFSKCGVIKLDEEQRPRVKIYRCAFTALCLHSFAGLVASQCGGCCHPAQLSFCLCIVTVSRCILKAAPRS